MYIEIVKSVKMSKDDGYTSTSCSRGLRVVLKDAVIKLKSVIDKWFSFGVQLGIHTEILNRIEMKPQGMDLQRCLTEVLDCYLRSDPDPSWEKIIAALEKIDERRLASTLKSSASTDQNLSSAFRQLSISPTPTHTESVANDFVNFCCKDCMSVISTTTEVTTVEIPNLPRTQASGHSFYTKVNPHGYEHTFYTVTKVRESRQRKSIRPVSDPTTWATWFPDYKWTIIYCNGITSNAGSQQRCSNHLGWIWEATTNNQRPQKFYGLRRPAVCLRPPINQ